MTIPYIQPELSKGRLILSYSEGSRLYTLECETVTAVSDQINANVLQVPIPSYNADNAFAFDSGSTEKLHFTIIRRNPEEIEDPPNIPDNVSEMYNFDWSQCDTTKWSNRVWKLALVSMVDRWQMRSDGISVMFIPIVLSDIESGDTQGYFQAMIDENGYIKTLNITYDINSFEVLRISMDIAIGTMNKG